MSARERHKCAEWALGGEGAQILHRALARETLMLSHDFTRRAFVPLGSLGSVSAVLLVEHWLVSGQSAVDP